MNKHLLSGFDAKVSRAKEHSCVLKASVDAFVADRNAYTILKEVDSKVGMFTFRLKLHREPPVVEWSLILGDCLHNMRSAFDHLFWALVLLKHPGALKDPKSVKNYWKANFPIYLEPARFNRRKSDLEYWVGKDVMTMLENMQPYQGAGPDKNGLRFINECDVSDKHRLLVPLAGIAEKGEFNVQLGRNMARNVHSDLPQIPMEDGAVIARITVTPPEAIVNVDFNPTLGVLLKLDGLREITLPSLVGLFEVCESARSDFDPLFTHTGGP